jgi:hypothetical protein
MRKRQKKTGGDSRKGRVAKNEQRRKKSELHSDLCGNPEEIRHELDLPLNITSAFAAPANDRIGLDDE